MPVLGRGPLAVTAHLFLFVGHRVLLLVRRRPGRCRVRRYPSGMNPAAAGLDVACPVCRGRSAVDAEYRHLSQWACPFCGASNAMPSPAAPPPPDARRIPFPSALAAVLVVVAVLAGVAGQRTIPRGDYRTIEGLTHAMAVRGVRCDVLVVDPLPPPGARAAAACTVGTAPVWLVTFASRERRDRYMGSTSPQQAAVGSTWIAVTQDRATARLIAARMDAALAPGAASDPSTE